jgi:hypothetical protein
VLGPGLITHPAAWEQTSARPSRQRPAATPIRPNSDVLIRVDFSEPGLPSGQNVSGGLLRHADGASRPDRARPGFPKRVARVVDHCQRPRGAPHASARCRKPQHHHARSTGSTSACEGVALRTRAFLTGRFWVERDLGALLSKETLISALHNVTFTDPRDYSESFPTTPASRPLAAQLYRVARFGAGIGRAGPWPQEIGLPFRCDSEGTQSPWT